MSQDMFADEELIDDPAPEQTEFSGVSGGSGTNSSQGGSQPSSALIPFTPPPPPPPVVDLPEKTPKGYQCGVCRKFLKTNQGFVNHTQLHFSRGQIAKSPAPNNPSSSEVFQCPLCKKDYATKTGLMKHEAAHRLKDALERMPTASEFKDERAEQLMSEIVLEILKEPAFGNESKSLFLIECEKSEKWPDFVTTITTEVSKCVFTKQSKLLPINQYEEKQKKMNLFLNQNIDRLKENLISCSSVQVSSALAGRLAFRITMKLFQGAEQWAMKKMQDNKAEKIQEDRELSESEEKLFLIDIGNFVRNYYEQGLQKFSEQRQSECIRKAFIDGQQPITKAQVLKRSNWYSGEEQCIVLSHHAASFFKILEFEIMDATEDICSSQNVFDNILLHRELLGHWYYLSSAYFSEDVSVSFLKDLVSSYVRFSLLFEEKRLNRLEEKSIRASAAALRTHLQRNYVEKEDESVISK